MDYKFAADRLSDIYEKLRQYEEFQMEAKMALYIGAELRKMAPPINLVAELNKLKPTPSKSDPNSKIPRPETPPGGSGPASLAHPSKEQLDAIMARHGIARAA